MDNMKQEQMEILYLIKSRQISADEGYRRILELKNRSMRDDRLHLKQIEIDLAKHPSSSNHILFNEQVMTLDGMIEMVYAFLQKNGWHHHISFRNILAKAPLKSGVSENGNKCIEVEYNTKNKQFVLKAAGEETPNVYLSGMVATLEVSSTPVSRLFPDDTTGYASVPEQEIYSIHKEAKIGAFYRNIKDFKLMGDKAVCRILPQAKGDFSLNISALNCVLLSALKLTQLHLNRSDSIYIPYKLDVLDVYGDLLYDNYQCYVKIQSIHGDSISIDAQIVDAQGKVIVNCGNLCIRQLIVQSSKSHNNQNTETNGVAIIGIAGKFPGANNYEEFWRLICEGRSAIQEVPKERWDIDTYYDSNPSTYQKTYCRKGGFLSDIDKFDARFFNITDREAELIDPQQRLFLEECWNALEDAGYATPEISQSNCGVFVGAGPGDYQDLMKSENLVVGPQSFWGNDSSVLASRISYYLNLKGPSIAVNTACSSSLVSIHLACKSILSGECDMAIAGGVFVATTPGFFIVSSNASMLSPDGGCYAFDHRANGFVPGEGAGAIVLKSIQQAINDRDHIYGIITASAVNQDGKTNGITAPSSLSQSEIEEKVYRQAGINPETIRYIETHGTGTPLGDPIEFEALSRTFKKYTDKQQFCAIGSVKVNIGHAANAAGIASAIKVALSLTNRTIPPYIGFEKENPNISFTGSPFYINKTPTPLKEENNQPLREAISSFGFSGTNCHILMEAAPVPKKALSSNSRPFLFPFSACSKESLKELLNNMLERLENLEEDCLADVAYTLGARRKHFNYRISLLAYSLTELITQLKEIVVKEISTHPSGMNQTADEKSHSVICLMEEAQKSKDGTTYEYKEVLEKIRSLYQAGSDFDWSKLYQGDEVSCIPLPTYSFQRRRHWLDLSERKTEKKEILSTSLSTVYFGKKWVPVKLEKNKAAEISADVVITDETDITRSFAGGHIITMNENDARDSYEVLSQRVASFISRNKEIEKQVRICVKVKNGNNNIPVTNNDYSSELTRGFLLLFNLVKSLSKNRGLKVDLIYLFATEDSTLNPFCSALEGLAKAIKMENPNFTFRIVEKHGDALVDEIEVLSKEYLDILKPNPATYVRYQGTERLLPLLSKMEVADDVSSVSSLRRNGTYLITGGLKGIGYIIATFLSKKYKARLILAGRSEIDGTIRKKLDEISENGGHVRYCKTDVSVYSDVKIMAETLEKTGESLHGIFHCAGVTYDSLLKDKTTEQTEKVFAPKMLGALNLLEIFRTKTSDFMMLFSSTTALFGSIGQADYSFANSFLDYLAQSMVDKSPKIISTNWFFWKNGGMQPNPDILKYMQKDFGLYPLPDEDGISMIENCLKLGNSNILALYGDKKKIIEALSPYLPVEVNKSKNDALQRKAEKGKNRSGKDIRRQMEEFLKSVISKESRIPVDEIDANTGFDVLGLDSIMITNLSMAMDKYFPRMPKTVFFEFSTIADLTGYLMEHYENADLPFYTEEQDADLVEIQEAEPVAEDNHLQVSDKKTNQEIAIIGMSGIYPKASDIGEFWNNLIQGRDCVEEIPSERWDHHLYSSESQNGGGKSYCKHGGFISEYKRFDPLFFNISPKDAEWMDPQERLLIQEVWHTLENAGYTRASLKEKKVGVFVGVTNGQYQMLETEISGTQVSPLISYASLANRISYLFNFNGPSLAIDTMCSSYLTTLHYACESIRNGECDLAIVGSANLIIHPNKYIQLSISKFASPKGRCHSFGKDADGYIPGEGVGAVLLKSLTESETDRDYIYGVIKGTCVNHGGKTNGYTVPNPKAQADLILSAFEKTRINPEDIGYIEAHGAGTPLGDPIEVEGLTRAFEKYTDKKQFCSLGSVKSNIGHLEAAAGLAGLTKVLLQFKHKTLVPTLHIESANPDIDFTKTPFQLQKAISPWNPVTKMGDDGKIVELPRLAGISAFGAGGSNGHVIVEEYVNSSLPLSGSDSESSLIVFSAKDENSLKRTVDKFQSFLKTTMSTKQKDFDKTREDVYQVITQLFDIPKEMLCEDNFLKDYGIDFFNYFRINQSLKDLGYDCLDDKLNPDNSTILDLIGVLCNTGGCERGVSTSLNTLGNIAYTLQVGREPMRHRLAVIASSKQDVLDKLVKWIENQPAEDIYTSSDTPQKSVTQENLDDNEIDAMLSNGNLASLARAWVSKKDIDWQKLKRSDPVFRVPIPGYTFNEEQYWLKQSKGNQSTGQHPLLGQNESTFDGILFSTELSGKEFFLNDHILLQSKVLPGMAYLEAARLAASFACNKEIFRIRNMIWNSIFKIENGPKTLYAALTKDEKWINCKFVSKTGGQETVHGMCRIITEDLTEAPETVDIDKIKSGCSDTVKGDDLYNFYQQGGLDYGPAFKMVKTVFYNQNEVLAFLSLPPVLDGDFDRFLLHPSMMDAALQGGICIKANHGGSGTKTHIPFFLEEISVYGRLEKECYSHITVGSKTENNDQADSGIRKLNCRIISKDGKVLIELKGFTARTAQLNPEDRKVQESKSNSMAVQSEAASECICFYHPVWEKKSIHPPVDYAKSSEVLLIFHPDHHFHNEVKERLKDQVVFVQHSRGYYTSEKNYEINTSMKSDFKAMFEDMKSKGNIPAHAIFYWPKKEVSDTNYLSAVSDNPGIVERLLERSAYSLLSFLQAWKEIFGKKEISLVFCKPSDEGVEKAFASTASGFSNSLQIHFPHVKMKTVEYCENSIDQIADHLLQEVYTQDGNKEIMITENERFVKVFQQVPVTFSNDLNFKTGGTYLITGGLGGIGKIICSYLVKKYQAKIVLLGRSPLSKENKAFMKELEKCSGKVLYYPCDITSSAQMDKAAQTWRQEVGSLNGVIHAAGIMSQKDILNKTRDEFANIMGPKVLGMLMLDRAMKDENLDLFISFSSTASMLGDYGRCDYSAANNFIDEYTNFREKQREKGLISGKSYVINWPIWEEGGMHVGSVEAENQMLKSSGLSYLKTQDAISCLETILGQDKCQTIIVSGEKEKILHLFSTTKIETSTHPVVEQAISIPKPVTGTVVGETVKESTDIKNDIKQMVAKLHHIDIQRLDCQENLDAYGFNSVTITELCGIINTRFNLDLNPTIFFEHPTIEKISKYIYGIVGSQKIGQRTLFEETDKIELEIVNPLNNLYLIDKPIISSKDDLYNYLKKCAQMYKDNSFSFDKVEILGNRYKSLQSNKKTLMHMLVELQKDQFVEVMTIGKGPVLLIIPGFGISGASLINQIGYLSKSFQIVIIHLPGSGLSDGIPDLLYPPKVNKTIIDVLDALAIHEKIAVMSFSFGGVIAQTLVANNPERFNLLVLGCSFTRTDSAETSEESLEDKFRKDFENTNTKEDFYEYYLMSKCVNRSAFEFLPKASLTKFATVDELHKISIPVLVLSGKLDAVVNYNESVIISENIKKCIHLRFTDGGHCVNLTKSKAFNWIVKNFIEANGMIKPHDFTRIHNYSIEVIKNYEC